MIAHLPGSSASAKVSSAVQQDGILQPPPAGGPDMAEVLAEYPDVVIGEDGTRYAARACGAAVPSGQWQGWLEFVEAAGGAAVRSGRETTQPNRVDTVYWATGLSAVYLEGALRRALHPVTRSRVRPPSEPAFDGPAPDHVLEPGVESILNPFSVYRKGETLLRRQLTAFSVWHLVNIVLDHGLSDLPAATLNGMTSSDLIEVIVAGVRTRTGAAVER
jgi:hypothetical protein